jgi:hypothetical protein
MLGFLVEGVHFLDAVQRLLVFVGRVDLLIRLRCPQMFDKNRLCVNIRGGVPDRIESRLPFVERLPRSLGRVVVAGRDRLGLDRRSLRLCPFETGGDLLSCFDHELCC